VNLQKSRKIKLLQAAFGTGNLEPGEENLHLRCPVCKDSRREKKKLYVQLDTGWYNCWVCNISGKNINYLFRKYASSYASQCVELFPTNQNLEPIQEEKKPVELPPDIKLLQSMLYDPDARDVEKYLRARGVSRADMYRWRICVSNDFKFRRKVIFPSFDTTGKLNYYTSRSIDETKFKYTNAKVPKKEIIFNEIDINWQDPIVLVEGVFDAIKCPDNAVVALGSTLSKKSALFQKLSKNQSTVIVAFDEDAADKSHRVCKLLNSAGCKVFRISVTGNDLGSRTKQEVKDLLQNIIPWTQELLISQKILGIKSGSIL